MSGNDRSLCLAGALAVAANNLHFIRLYGRLVVQFEGDVFDEECPYFVAEAICIQVALLREALLAFDT